MIYDHLDRLDNYRGLGARFAAAIDWLTVTDLPSLTYYPPKQVRERAVSIVGQEEVFAMLSTYPPTAHDQIVWESHRIYADIQVIVAGAEQMGIASLHHNPPIKQDYFAAIDAAFYHLPGPDAPAPHTAFLPFMPRTFAIFLPQDIHAPNLALPGHDDPIRKIVVKVAL